MSDKQKIELMIPEELLEDYLAQINISSSYVARLFEYRENDDWSSVDMLLIEAISYDKILELVNSLPDLVEVIVIEDTNEQYLYKAQLDRHGVHFTSRQKFLEKFELDQEEVPAEEESKKKKEKTPKKQLPNLLSFMKRKKEDELGDKESKLSQLLSREKLVTQKVEVRSTKKETLIPIIKKQELVINNSHSGAYAVCMSAFICFLLSEYLSKGEPLALVDFTGELNQYFRSDESGKVKELISGVDDPYVISEKLYYYGDTITEISVEDFLKIKERLHVNAKIIIICVQGELVEAIAPLVDKVFYSITEEDIIKNRRVNVQISNQKKLKIIINKRLSILSRTDIRAQLDIGEEVELLELPLIENSDLKSIYKSIEKEEPIKLSVLEKYFKKFLDQL